MPKPLDLQAAERLLHLTRALGECLSAGQIADLDYLLTERQRVLDSLPSPAGPHLTKVLTEVQTLEADIMRQMETTHAEISQEMAGERKQRAAHTQYRPTPTLHGLDRAG